ncbi:unnamed protein product [Ilex paraguariensis]|uniref:5'-3' DNA helicase ZGRF1-like N-terminal domain-containing protein n=1 Tax=Ilex paraguariensis TaxID=185542 RepID=A0ABC8U522_9AQUA
MADAKKWSVTYTKHIKQKRKVYQDGFLELHSSSHKVLLYDDCEKLLESRFVKKEDVIRSGETLEFDAYQVDIGDSHGDHKSIPNLNFQGRDKKVMEKSGNLHGQKFRNNPISVENKNANSGKNKAPSSNLSPSQKIIRGYFDHIQHLFIFICKVKQVLYTKQITQKAKKFHDGFLRLANCGSSGRQGIIRNDMFAWLVDSHVVGPFSTTGGIMIMLYDATRTLLDSRFLKKDEIIRSGESLAFDAHLVDIGETEEIHKAPMGLKAPERNCRVVGNRGTLHEQEDEAHNGSPVVGTFVSTYLAIVTLLTEDGNILSRKFLKLLEDVTTGSALKLPNYLVEVPELPFCECFNSDVLGESLKNASPLKHVDSNFRSYGTDKIKFSRRVPAKQPFRDVHEILSILKKPIIQERFGNMERASLEKRHASQSSGFFHSEIQNQVEEQTVQDFYHKRSATEDCDKEFTATHNYSGEISKSKAVDNDPSIEISESADSNNRGDSQPKIFYFIQLHSGDPLVRTHETINQALLFIESLLVTSTSGESEISGLMVNDVVCTESDRSRTRPNAPVVEAQVWDALKLDSEGPPPTASVLPDMSNGIAEKRDYPDLMPSKGKSGFSTSHLSNKVKPGNFPQPCAVNMGN